MIARNHGPVPDDGAFAWHWHNRWDDRIEDGSKFQLLEARMHQTLEERGYPVNPVTGATS